MPSTQRHTIVAAIVTRMGTITTGNGYETNAGTNIDLWRSAVDAYDRDKELPAIAIYDVSDEWEPMSYGQDRHLHRLTVELHAATTTITQARSVIGDIHKAINTGGRTFGVSCVQQTTPRTDVIAVDEAERKILGAIVTIEVEYMTTSYDPYTGG